MGTRGLARADVIVIGAGLSGLCTAGLLARHGLSVNVIEAQPRPGGYIQGFSRKGFRFDSAVMWLNNVGPGGFVSRMFREIAPSHPECKPLERIWRFKGDSFDYLLTNHPDDLRDSLIMDFPGEAKGLERLFAHAKALGERMRSLNFRMRCPDSMSIAEKSLFGLKMLAWYLPVRHILRDSLEKGLARYVRDPAISNIFCAEEKLSALMVPLAWAYEGDFYSAPQGGSQAFVTWLMEALDQLGAQVNLGIPVHKVLTDTKGNASGVKLSNGTVIHAKWVVAACDVEQLYERMLPSNSVPEKFLTKLREADLYYSSFSVFCGLNRPARDLGFGEEIIRLTRDDIPREQQYSGDARASAISVFAPSVRDASLAPEQKGTLTIQCPAYISDHDRWHTGHESERGESYRKHKYELAQQVLGRIEQQLGIEVRSSIEELCVATPITYWRYTWNKNGSIMGAKPTDRNIKSHLAHYRTSIPRLLLAGSWAEYGGGIPMAVKAAANVSAMILKEEKPRAFLSLKRAMDT